MKNESGEQPAAHEMDALSELLDEALDDFRRQPPPKTSDDDLDDFLAPMDQAATRKAAGKLRVAIPQAMEGADTKAVNPNNPSHEFLSELLGIKQFLEDEGVEPEFRTLIEGFLKDAFTKDQFKELIDEYLGDESVEMSEEERKNLVEQQQTFADLIAVYESSAEPPTAEQTEQQNALWAKLRDLGEIPQPLIARFESKFQGGALPSIPGLPALGPGGSRTAKRSFSLYRVASCPGVDYLRHPSGIIILQLGADHEALAKGIAEFSFDTSNKKAGGQDRSKQSVGGLKLLPETKICKITCTDGSVHMLRAGIKATLIEVNTRLLANPALLTSSRDYAGYLIIVIPTAVINNQRNHLPPEFGPPLRVALEIGSMVEAMAADGKAAGEDGEPPAKQPKQDEEADD
ncbi:hypothetical protein M3Y99_00804300 [Aphelenchoides fujianensis]|nr:hypothetical protein M3Y99_00804300 [Aphelenchoides fujianensis]